MKKKTKLFLSLGAVPITLVPLATTFAMSTSTNDLVAFYNKVNTGLHSNISNLKLQQIQQTQWYKDNYLKISETDREELFKSIVALIHSNEIDDNDKVDIAKLLQEHQAYLNFGNEFGFNKMPTIHQIDETNTQDKLLSFEGVTTSNILQNNNTINLNGATGLNADASHDGTKVFSISNQDILNYFTLSLTSSSKFNDLLKFVNTAKKQLLTGMTTLPQAWTTYIQMAKDALAPLIANNSVSEARIKATNLFKIFDTVDTSALGDENQFFKAIINSEIGKYFHASEADRNALVNDYETNVDPDDKNMMSSNIFKSIETSIKSLIGNKSTIMNDFIESKQITINNVPMTINEFKTKEVEVEWLDLVAQMVKFSNGFSDGIEFIRQVDISQGDGIFIKTGFLKHNPVYKLQPNELRVKMENLDLMSIYNTPEQAEYRNQELSQSGIYDVGSPIYTSHVDLTLDEQGKSLNANPKAVLSVDSESNFQTSLSADLISVGPDGKESIVKTVVFDGNSKLHENDHDNDSSIKNTETYVITPDHWVPNNTGSPYPSMTHISATYGTRVVPWVVKLQNNDANSFTWKDGVPVNQTKFYLRFHRGSYLDKTLFDELNSALNRVVQNEYQRELQHIQDIKDGKVANDIGIDVTSTHEINLKLQSITFGEIRFNTYDDSGWDDTHSDHFRFSKVSAAFEIIVNEK